MEQITTIKHDNYEQASKTLSRLFEFDSHIEQQINCYMQHYGIIRFFRELETLELASDVIAKLSAVRTVLFNLKAGEKK